MLGVRLVCHNNPAIIIKMEVSSATCFTLGILIAASLATVSGLECYACENQEGNKDKCTKTTKQCEEHQSICMTTIRWGLPPYWVPYGDRDYFVSKNCEVASVCEQKKQEMNPNCKRDWFDDWGCVECCTGDLCNYYVTLGAGNIRASLIATCTALMTGMLLRRLV